MIGLDTNIVVRLLTGDDPDQQQIARQYIAEHCTADDPAQISTIIAVETVWVLERAYRYARVQIADALERLLHAAEVAFEEREAVRAAIAHYREGAGFADAMIAACSAHHVSHIITFDRDAAGWIPAFRLLA